LIHSPKHKAEFASVERRALLRVVMCLVPLLFMVEGFDVSPCFVVVQQVHDLAVFARLESI